MKRGKKFQEDLQGSYGWNKDIDRLPLPHHGERSKKQLPVPEESLEFLCLGVKDKEKRKRTLKQFRAKKTSKTGTQRVLPTLLAG